MLLQYEWKTQIKKEGKCTDGWAEQFMSLYNVFAQAV